MSGRTGRSPRAPRPVTPGVLAAVLLLAGGLLPAARPTSALAQQGSLGAPAADHHLHVRSPDMVEALLKVQEAVGQSVIEADAGALAAEDALAVLDRNGIRRGAVLSTAYMFGVPDVDFEDEAARTRAENDYVSDQVARHPDRLVGFCSVNPLAGYALEELRRCAGLPGIVGYKLHFANSDVDLRDGEHVARLKEVFGLAEELGMALVVHMRTRSPDYGAEDARVFVRELLPLAPSVPVQVAHMAGWGNYDDATDAALGVFAEAIEEGTLERDDVLFDLAAVVVPLPRAAAVDTSMVSRVREGHDRLARRIRQIGPGRVLYGTDWDAVAVDVSVATYQTVLPLTPAELADVTDNRAPYLP